MQPSSVPVLASAAGPVLEFERRILDSMTDIEHWFRQNWQEHTPPFYGSVDLRNSGFKLAPVDMNLFPGGFNNLSEDALPCAVQAAQVAIERNCPDARKLLLIPERHTRNVFYLQNVARLVRLLATPGLEVRVGTLSPDVTKPSAISLPGGERLMVEPVRRHGDRVGLEDFDPCIVLLNNDLSAGIPPEMRDRYRERDIQQKPFVIVKADAGTYGMGIMTVRDASEVVGLSRKQRNKMAVVKEGLEVSDVIIQEGVPTYETIDQAVAEPVVYMIDRYVVGGFYRVHRQRGIDENLNAPGMEFVPLAFSNPCNLPNVQAEPGSSAQNRFYCYGVMGRLALLAASIELERTAAALAPTSVGDAEGLSPALSHAMGQTPGVRVGA